ncbi:GNAT family acetyltransferase [Klebsiella pneumoniae]|uniref:GNAT family acetyltransferase n=1 Tax=Klebsiella pneumoniae TaxID=573 RepID=A0A377W698_KLEPN|nr:GNAT family acetyltransferase [Klebsiella pneumoniae]
MMVIEGKEAIRAVDWQRVRTIIAEAGLNERDVQQLEQAFRQSTFCWFGYENGQLIAVARAISDCTWSSYLADVAIVPARQGQGYGATADAGHPGATPALWQNIYLCGGR